MIRPLAAALALSAVLSFDMSTATADPSQGYPASVLRFRGGQAFPDPGSSSGTGWVAGGSIGIALNHDVLLSLGFDHVFLDETKSGIGRHSINPVTIEMELGTPTEHHFTPRVAAGVGPYFHEDVDYIYPEFGFGPPQRVHALNNNMGVHLGVGVSVPLGGKAMMDVDYRYHVILGEGAFEVGLATVGLRFLFPGRAPDPEGYVLSSGEAHAND